MVALKFLFISFFLTFMVELSFSFCPSKNEKPDPFTVYVRSVSCKISPMIANPKFSCFAKSYNRTCSIVNILATFRKPVVDFDVSIILKYLNLSTFHSQFRSHPKLFFKGKCKTFL